MTHIPVLVDAVIEYLDIQPHDIVFDGTLGMGGHAQEIINRLGSNGFLVGCDKDPEALTHCISRFQASPNSQLLHGSYANIQDHLNQSKHSSFQKIFIDCGLSSTQLNHPNRGFSFQSDGPLDMRMNPSQTLTAAIILNTYTKSQLKHLLETYGDVYPNDRFIENILHTRKTHPLQTTPELLHLIKKSYFFRNNRKRYINMCARIFQALRIEVNQELSDLEQFLENLEQVISPNGHVVMITFHSTEDRIVKHFFKNHLNFQPLGKVIKPTQDEIKQNSRARSAKVRGYISKEKEIKEWKKKKFRPTSSSD